MIRLKIIVCFLVLSLSGLSCSSQAVECDFTDKLLECGGEIPSGFRGDYALSKHSLVEFKRRLEEAKASKEIYGPHLGIYARSNISLINFLERYRHVSRFFTKGEFEIGIPDIYWAHYAISELSEKEFEKEIKKGENANINIFALGEFVISGLDVSTFLSRINEASEAGISGMDSGKYAASNCSL